jgi:hypothetical protein
VCTGRRLGSTSKDYISLQVTREPMQTRAGSLI